MKSNLLCLAILAFLFTSCKQDKLNKSLFSKDMTLQAFVLADEAGKDGKGEKDEMEPCFDIVFPISITMPDGSILSGEEETLWSAVKVWYEAHPDSKEKPSIDYPIDILWKEDITKTVQNEEEMIVAKKYCQEYKEEKKDCFELVYPVEWVMPDASTITMNAEDDWEVLKSWYEVNPDVKEEPALHYPVDILFENGDSKTISTEEEMELVKKDC